MRPRTLVAVALAMFALSRVAFFFHNPDWGTRDIEHCFSLTWPEIYDKRQAVEPDPGRPYGSVDPAQFYHCYHSGSALVGHAIRGLVSALGSRTLLAHKVLGTLMAGLFVGLLAWTLRTLWPERRDWVQVAAPLFLCAFPPTLFLWLTMTPKGLYYEGYLFYGLFLPFYVATARGQMSRKALFAAGALGGFATAYTFSNFGYFVVFGFAWMLFVVERGWKDRLKAVGIVVAGTVAGFASIGHGRSIWDNLVLSPFTIQEDTVAAREGGEQLGWIGFEAIYMSIAERATALCTVVVPGSSLAVHTAVDIAGILFTVATALAVVVPAVALLRISRLRSMEPSMRFLALNGILVLGIFATYVGFRGQLWKGRALEPVEYLAPLFPALFVGAGVVLNRALHSRKRWIRLTGWSALGSSCCLLLLGWGTAVATNARPTMRPEMGSCDSVTLGAYFMELSYLHPRRESWPLLRGPLEAEFALDEGLRRCHAAHPGDEDVCTFFRYTLTSQHLEMERQPCAGEPEPYQDICARAVGGQLYSRHVCADPFHAQTDVCEEFAPEQRQQCLSGAWQGQQEEGADEHTCVEQLRGLCQSIAHDDLTYSACLEQTAAMLAGMPPLPGPSQELPAECSQWPSGWLGLCERAIALAARRPRDEAASCEAVYLARYAGSVPGEGYLMFDQCLVADPGTYPWCAIGVARARGETDCAWAGGAPAKEGAIHRFWQGSRHLAVPESRPWREPGARRWYDEP